MAQRQSTGSIHPMAPRLVPLILLLASKMLALLLAELLEKLDLS
jgi:hypothetical protein